MLLLGGMGIGVWGGGAARGNGYRGLGRRCC